MTHQVQPKPPIDIIPKVPFWPVLISTGGLAQPDVSPCTIILTLEVCFSCYLHRLRSADHGGDVWERDARGLAEVRHQPPQLVQRLVLHQDVIPVETNVNEVKAVMSENSF